MALIDDNKNVCDRLAPEGWGDLFAAHGLDIGAADLAAELARPLPGVRRGLKGFEDFAAEGVRGVEPGRPQHSLLYHALASPGVLNGPGGSRLRAFPTLAEIELVEDYVFAAAGRSLDEVRTLAGGPVALVVFSAEYRPASETCSRLHADLVFSRTGVARVGTAPAEYDPARRGFLPESAQDPFAIRALPARYVAYLAVRLPGSRAAFRPMRFQNGDQALRFWVPVHKLFPGDECLVGLDLTLSFSTFHANDKIRRIHLGLGVPNPPTTPPFRITQGIASLAATPASGRGLLVPDVHPRLVEEARLPGGAFATYDVPRNNGGSFAAFEPGSSQGLRPFPEYVHARTEVRNGTQLVDLNDDPDNPDVRARVAAGGYAALHYVDFTGDGFVRADSPELAAAGVSESRPAYSLVTAPDFFPTCDQRELTEWTSSNAVPESIRDEIWPVPPETLCDQRLAANLQLPGGPGGGQPFDPTETTMPALVPLFGDPPGPRTEPPPVESLRHSWLPDDAAGIFAPGWDVTRDQFDPPGQQPVRHMAAYGLGSPFPEDAKLCSALSAFWPAVAPDATRTMDPPPNPRLRSTTSPLTDEEIGRIGSLPWDGVPGPVVVSVGDQPFADYPSFMHADYVRNALAGKFTMRLTARIGAGEYERRALAMALVYRAVGGNRNDWMLLSFRKASVQSPEVQAAMAEAQTTAVQEPVYFFDLFEFSEPTESPDDFRRRRIPIRGRHLMYCDPDRRIVLMKRPGAAAFAKADVGDV